MNRKNKLAIFDLDGTLFDTKNVNYTAYNEALKRCGLYINFDYQYYCDFCNGNNYKIFLPQIISGITDEQMQTIHAVKKKLYPEYLDLAVKNDHLFSIIDLISKEYVVALVTTACRQNTGDILNLFNVKNKFDLIITQEDVNSTKPDPECFLLAMKNCHIDRENTFIFEDSDTGIEAAEKSGAKYIRVYGYN